MHDDETQPGGSGGDGNETGGSGDATANPPPKPDNKLARRNDELAGKLKQAHTELDELRAFKAEREKQERAHAEEQQRKAGEFEKLIQSRDEEIQTLKGDKEALVDKLKGKERDLVARALMGQLREKAPGGSAKTFEAAFRSVVSSQNINLLPDDFEVGGTLPGDWTDKVGPKILKHLEKDHPDLFEQPGRGGNPTRGSSAPNTTPQRGMFS